ncbi:MAG: MFS transporter [Desulfuromonadales bacterium]|nr:MFS transporter [Desulfuromonadales bacterium]
MALFPMAIITLFWKDQIGLSLTEILLLQAIFSVATLVMEYPSGYLSDRLGYRFTLHLACLLGIAGWTVYTFAGSFAGVLLAEILLGVSYAFISGADTALLYETLRQSNREEEYARHDGRMTAWAQSGEAAGALFAGVLYAWAPLLPFIIQIGVWVAALLVCRGLKEPPGEEAPQHSSHLGEAWRIARMALLDRPEIRWSLILTALLGLATFYPVWLIQPYMQAQSVPLAWFGPIWAVANLTVSAGSLLSHRLLYHTGPRGMVLLCLLLVCASYLGLGLSHAIWGFAFYFLMTLMRGIQGPFFRHCIQKQSRRYERASILSLKSLLFRLGFVVTGPGVGLFADHFGLHATMLALGAAMTLPLIPVSIYFLKSTRGL